MSKELTEQESARTDNTILKASIGLIIGIIASVAIMYMAGGFSSPKEVMKEVNVTLPCTPITINRTVTKEVPASFVVVNGYQYDARRITELLENGCGNNIDCSSSEMRNKAIREIANELDRCGGESYDRDDIEIDYDDYSCSNSRDRCKFEDIEIEYNGTECRKSYDEITVYFDDCDADRVDVE